MGRRPTAKCVWPGTPGKHRPRSSASNIAREHLRILPANRAARRVKTKRSKHPCPPPQRDHACATVLSLYEQRKRNSGRDSLRRRRASQKGRAAISIIPRLAILPVRNTERLLRVRRPYFSPAFVFAPSSLVAAAVPEWCGSDLIASAAASGFFPSPRASRQRCSTHSGRKITTS